MATFFIFGAPSGSYQHFARQFLEAVPRTPKYKAFEESVQARMGEFRTFEPGQGPEAVDSYAGAAYDAVHLLVR